MTEATASASGDNGSTSATVGAAETPGQTSTSAAMAAPAAAAPAASGIDWLKDATETDVGYTQNKGWKTPNDLLASYQNLEKLFGADKAGNTVVLPKEGASTDELNQFYSKLGRPSDPEGYKLAVPEQGGDPEFAKTAAGWFHELGLTQKQGQDLVAKWNEHIGSISAAQQTQSAQSFNADVQALKSEWGAAHDQNVVIARNTANALGLDAATIDKLSSALGHKGTMDLLYKIGAKSGEDSFVSGQGGTNFKGAMTPAQAKSEIQTLMQDRDFVSKYLSKNADAVAKMQQLHGYAYPQE